MVADQLELVLESRQRKQGFCTNVYCPNKLGLAIEILQAPTNYRGSSPYVNKLTLLIMLLI